MAFIFPYIYTLGRIIPTDYIIYIFQRGRSTTNQWCLSTWPSVFFTSQAILVPSRAMMRIRTTRAAALPCNALRARQVRSASGDGLIIFWYTSAIAMHKYPDPSPQWINYWYLLYSLYNSNMIIWVIPIFICIYLYIYNYIFYYYYYIYIELPSEIYHHGLIDMIWWYPAYGFIFQ